MLHTFATLLQMLDANRSRDNKWLAFEVKNWFQHAINVNVTRNVNICNARILTVEPFKCWVYMSKVRTILFNLDQTGKYHRWERSQTGWYCIKWCILMGCHWYVIVVSLHRMILHYVLEFIILFIQKLLKENLYTGIFYNMELVKLLSGRSLGYSEWSPFDGTYTTATGRAHNWYYFPWCHENIHQKNRQKMLQQTTTGGVFGFGT